MYSCYDIDIESFGTGLKRMADVCDEAGVRYEFKKLKSGFVVCFYRSQEKADKTEESPDKVKQSTDKTEKSPDKVKKSTGKTEESPDKMNESTDKTQRKSGRLVQSKKKIIEYILKEGKITNKETQILLNVKESRARKILKELTDQEVLEQKGKLKSSHYILKHKD